MNSKRFCRVATVAAATVIAGASGFATPVSAKQFQGFSTLGDSVKLRTNLIQEIIGKHVYTSAPQTALFAQDDKSGEGKCGEGKCGEGKCGDTDKGKGPEGKCGEGKCG